MNTFRSVRGVRDIFSTEGRVFNEINNAIKNIFFGLNFEFLETPVIENSNIFERATGEDSDIVMKEIYKFQDKGENTLALRPEFTAGVVRFLIENNLTDGPFPRRYISSGPLFRYDRPQKGRYRQFYQINCETFGSSNGVFEILSQLKAICCIFRSLNVRFKLKINHLSNTSSRQDYINALRFFLEQKADDLSSDSKQRLVKNPLRILDSKAPQDIDILQDAPRISNFYKGTELDFLSILQSNLNALGFEVEHDCRLVRGLDYYSGFIFEFISNEEGYALCGGGEYNHLISSILQKPTSINAFGFAFGLDRVLLEVLKSKGGDKKDLNFDKKENIKIIFMYDKFFNTGGCSCGIFDFLTDMALVIDVKKNTNLLKSIDDCGLRYFGVSFAEKRITLDSFEISNIKKGLEKADKMGADFAIIKCEEEISTEKVIIKNLYTKHQVIFDDSVLTIK